MRRITLCLFCLIAIISQTAAQDFEIQSPNGQIKLMVDINEAVTFSASLAGNTVIEKAIVAMDLADGVDFGVNAKVKDHAIGSASSMIYPAIAHKDAAIKDEYKELVLTFSGNYQLTFRAYNDGIAYQFVDAIKGNKKVMSEQLSLTFPEGTTSMFPQEESMYSHNERLYLNKSLNDLSSKDFCSLPVLFQTSDANVLFTETAVHDYPGLFLRGNANETMDAIFPKYVLKAIPNTESSPDRNQILAEEADYIAKVDGARTYPWRVFIISEDDRTLIESNLTYQLSKPQVLENTDWIKPGRVAWDWYNANNVYGVNFEAGLNTATYKYYLDFAAANGIEYVILDEGWTKSTTEILDFNPDIDVPALIQYGKAKGVELILWVLWKPLDENMDEILETYKSWGVKGIKVDFMQRNDQYMVSSYEQIAKKCAELELIVDFHGAFKPSGLRRTYPNVINYEGVKGAENNKWSKDITPQHNVTIPFIRMAAGPMDYTPGAMSNAHIENYNISFERPMSIGTRAHQVAMYVVYESPLQMLCESPSRYYEEQETVDFITQIPTTWDETIVLHGSVGEYIAVARKNGEQWYIGAMTGAAPQTLELDLSFLDGGTYHMEIFRDSANTKRFAEDYTIDHIKVSQQSSISASMVAGGGWSAILSKQK